VVEEATTMRLRGLDHTTSWWAGDQLRPSANNVCPVLRPVASYQIRRGFRSHTSTTTPAPNGADA
jgi:hypothetical protein